MHDRTAEAIREGEQVARERHQAEVEMEQALIAQEQTFEAGTGVPIAEQADQGDNAHDDGSDVITAGGVEEYTDAPAPPSARHVEFEHGERTFEGEGRHPLAEQDSGGEHAF